MEGFSGFTPTGSKKTIDEIRAKGREVHATVEKANQAFFSNLSTHWYSPTAQKFDEAFEPKIYETQEKIITELNKIIRSAVQAYNAFASINEIASIGLEDGDEYEAVFDQQNSTYGQYTTLSTDKEGAVVMDKAAVATDVATLRGQYQTAQSILDTMPDAVYIYDPNGDIATAYTTLLTSTKASLNTLINDIALATETEMNLHVDENTTAEGTAAGSFGGGGTA